MLDEVRAIAAFSSSHAKPDFERGERADPAAKFDSSSPENGREVEPYNAQRTQKPGGESQLGRQRSDTAFVRVP